MSGHTPGSWKVRVGRNEDEFFVQAPRLDPSHPYDIEIMGDDHGHELYPTEMRRADARLIASAPDLLEALKQALHEQPGWFETAKTAIQKAESKP